MSFTGCADVRANAARNGVQLLEEEPIAARLRVIAAEMPHHLVIFAIPPLTADDVFTFAPRVDD